MQISQILRTYKIMTIGGVSPIIHHLIKDKNNEAKQVICGTLVPLYSWSL